MICGKGLSRAQLDRAERGLAVCWRSIPSHRSETSRWSVLRDKKESVCSCKHGIRSLLLSLHPLRVCHFCVKVHSLCPVPLPLILKTVKNDNFVDPPAVASASVKISLFFSLSSFFEIMKIDRSGSRTRPGSLFFSIFLLF